jgi:hypothetical protein
MMDDRDSTGGDHAKIDGFGEQRMPQLDRSLDRSFDQRRLHLIQLAMLAQKLGEQDFLVCILSPMILTILDVDFLRQITAHL